MEPSGVAHVLALICSLTTTLSRSARSLRVTHILDMLLCVQQVDPVLQSC
jgi:hypothetical protein